MDWKQLEHASIADLIAWAEPKGWCRAMAACAQDSEWHAEGDVWTHTQKVLYELERLPEWPALTARDQTVLKFTALLHDVAKPVTTQIDTETGRVTSPKHAVKGEAIARSLLRELNCQLSIREEITRMVRYHGRPVFLLDRADPSHEVIRLSWLVNNRLLYLFALADTRGRDTDSLNRPEENLHYWKLASEESDCFDRPFPFANPQARYRFFRSDNPDVTYVPYEQYSCTVTMLSGLPGAGKDTWIQQHFPELPVISLDEVRSELDVEPTDDQGQVAQLAKERCREYLRTKTSFVFNATNTMRVTRGRWLELFNDYEARIRIVYLEPSFAEILRRNRNRARSVPEQVIRRLADKLETPTWLECHDLLITDGI